MKKQKIIFLTVLSILFICQNSWSQNLLEVEGELSMPNTAVINVHGNFVENVADPQLAQDAATKAYVDNLLLSFGVSIGSSGIQGLLNVGFSPSVIISNGAPLTDFIGLNHEGGIIFYMDPSGNGTGLVSAVMDQSTGAQWGCFGTLIGGTNETIGTGQANTTAIVNGCGETGIAAKLCDDLVVGIYDDWYLPSKDELNEMWVNLADSDGDGTNTGPSDPNNIGGFADSFYWSSSEFDDFNAWLQSFNDGFQPSGSKGGNVRVRAIRAF